MLKMKRTVLWALFLLMILFKPWHNLEAMEQQDSNEILVIGTAKISGSNEAAEREEALGDALKRGIEGYLVKRIGSRGIINNFQKIVHDLVPKSKELVDNFFILSEARLEKELRILVRIRLNESLINKKMKEYDFILFEGVPLKVLFLIGQIGPQSGEKTYWWQDLRHPTGPSRIDSYFAKLFEESGMQTVNRFSQTLPQNMAPEMFDLNLNEEQLLQLGGLFGADVVLYGTYEGNVYKEVIVNLSALDVKKGTWILKDHLIEKGLEGTDMTQLAERAVYKISRRMAPLIIKSVESQEIKTQQFEVTVNGLKNFKQFREIKEFLEKKVKGTQGVKQTGSRGDSVTIIIEYRGDPQTYLAQLANPQNLSFKFSVEKADEGKLIFTIR